MGRVVRFMIDINIEHHPTNLMGEFVCFVVVYLI